MAKAKVYNLDGVQTEEIDLDDKIFDQKANKDLIYQVVKVAKANQRQALAHTKNRSEVRGGGRKPWKQKGTGRARHGSTRSPIWKGGGVTFGPRKENITKLSVPVKMKRKALMAVFSEKVKDNKFIIIEDIEKLDKPSTKKMHGFFKKLEMESKKVLFLSDRNSDLAVKSLRNIPKTKSIRIENINILDMLSYGRVMTSKKAVEELSKQLSR